MKYGSRCTHCSSDPPASEQAVRVAMKGCGCVRIPSDGPDVGWGRADRVIVGDDIICDHEGSVVQTRNQVDHQVLDVTPSESSSWNIQETRTEKEFQGYNRWWSIVCHTREQVMALGLHASATYTEMDMKMRPRERGNQGYMAKAYTLT